MLLGARVRAGSRSIWTAQYHWKKKWGVAFIWTRLLSLSRIHYSGHGFWGSGWAVQRWCVQRSPAAALCSIPVCTCRLAAPLSHCCPAWWIFTVAELCWWCSSSMFCSLLRMPHHHHHTHPDTEPPWCGPRWERAQLLPIRPLPTNKKMIHISSIVATSEAA